MPLYAGINGANRDTKTLYAGIGGVNREIKQIYAGINGVNRELYSAEKPLFKAGSTQAELSAAFELWEIHTPSHDYAAVQIPTVIMNSAYNESMIYMRSRVDSNREDQPQGNCYMVSREILDYTKFDFIEVETVGNWYARVCFDMEMSGYWWGTNSPIDQSAVANYEYLASGAYYSYSNGQSQRIYPNISKLRFRNNTAKTSGHFGIWTQARATSRVSPDCLVASMYIRSITCKRG